MKVLTVWQSAAPGGGCLAAGLRQSLSKAPSAGGSAEQTMTSPASPTRSRCEKIDFRRRSCPSLRANRFGSRPPLAGVPYCRPGIPVGFRQSVSKVPPPGAPLSAHPGAGFPFRHSPVQGQPRLRFHSGSPLPPTASAGRFLWVESHSDVFATGSWACEALRTVNCLRTYLPAVFTV
jgi:hypothetical protein